MDNSILSIGIDIGTTTTSMIISRLFLSNTANSFAVPHVDIVGKEIIYKSEIYFTPLIDGSIIDGDEIKRIIGNEYKKAVITPSMIDTGAVIITGESARKENADIVLKKLSEFAGEFVVATAGPDLESIIAGKGAGASDYSKAHNSVVANLDIGGGTTNIAVFSHGKLLKKSYLDIGGRLIKYNRDGKISYISDRLNILAREHGFEIKEGMQVSPSRMQKITDIMVRKLEEVIRDFSSEQMPIKYISFSGGVADCLYKEEKNIYKYGDIGVSLSDSIRQSELYRNYKVIVPKETIRATVVGAGIYTTTVSGSTISYDCDILPIKNLPAFVVGEAIEQECLLGKSEELICEAKWFLEQSNSENIIFCFKGGTSISYSQLVKMAESIYKTVDKVLDKGKPLIILVENDMAKSLGQSLKRIISMDRNIICIDKVVIEKGDYIDLGKPLMNGLALPVVVKTLIFNN